MDIEEKFMNRKLFTELVESAVVKMKLSYIDAVCIVCEREGIEHEDCKKFVNRVIKEKLEAEARALNFLTREQTLSFE